MREIIKARRAETSRKPHMVIIDDQPQMMGRFVKNFEALGFDVTPIIISRGDIDQCFHSGRIDHKKLAEEIVALQNDPESWAALQQREALAHFQYGAKSKTELKSLLAQLKPNVVLSDERMRLERKNIADEAQMRADDNVVCGADAMAICKDLFPDVPRAIHTMIYDAQIKPVPRGEIVKAQKQGHMVFAKDDYEDKEQPQAVEIAAWFKGKLKDMGRPGVGGPTV